MQKPHSERSLWGCLGRRALEPSSLENTFRMVEPNHQPALLGPVTTPCSSVPQRQVDAWVRIAQLSLVGNIHALPRALQPNESKGCHAGGLI